MNPPAFSRMHSPDGIAFYRTGDGAPALLLHGVGLRAECWLPQIRALRQTHSVFAADLPGHGESMRLSAPRLSLSDFVDKIGGFLKTAARCPALFVGHSAGALIALTLAARFPESCCGVAALNAVHCRPSAARKTAMARADSLHQGGDASSRETIVRWFGEHPRGRADIAARWCSRWLESADRRGYAALYRVFAEEDGPTMDALSALRMPSLFLTGEKDPNSTPEMSGAMAKIAPRGRAAIIKGARHLAQLTHSAEVNAELQTFADECAKEQ